MMNHDGSAALADTERERVDAYVAVHELDDQFAALRPIGRILKSTTSGIVAAAAEVDTELGTIASVCDAIRRIAFQARLLSLNARLEASRAGDAGRAFGVVAGEFNTFATEITNAAAQINKSVEQALSAASRNEDAVAALADAVAVGAEVIARLSAGHAGAESTADLQHVEVVRFA